MDLIQLYDEARYITGDEEPVYAVVRASNRVRPGESPRTHPLADNGELLRNAPAVKGDYFKVANILE